MTTTTPPSTSAPTLGGAIPDGLVPDPPASFTERLGLQGWQSLDPVLLASLALEAPLLLIGPHGTAKSLVAERVAGALGSSLRHYNASLLNYDDLVGIPVPDEAGTGLVYLGAAGAVWDAEFLFLDEINRCRPDLQNKLFPLVHERRLAGEDLPRLRHRWAAVNPPGESGGESYLGVEELDLALADRFWFVVPVPGWSQLDRHDRVRLVRDGAEPVRTASAVDRGAGTAADDVTDLAQLVAEVAATAAAVETVHAGTLAEYVVALVDQLGVADVHLSPRRARVLLRAICGVHAARHCTDEDEPRLVDSAELALLHALPQRASVEGVPLPSVLAAHRQAWELAVVDESGVLGLLLAESDLVARVQLGVDFGVDDDLLGRLVVQALAAETSAAARAGLAFVVTRAFAGRALTPAAWGVVVDTARPVLTPVATSDPVGQGRQLERVRAIDAYCAGLDDSPASLLERAFLQGCRPFLQREGGWRARLTQFRDRCREFGVES